MRLDCNRRTRMAMSASNIVTATISTRTHASRTTSIASTLTCKRTRAHAQTHKRTNAQTHAHAHARTHACTHVHTRADCFCHSPF
eukprot:6174318-Pleurochrysis_carterae.AAC.1